MTNASMHMTAIIRELKQKKNISEKSGEKIRNILNKNRKKNNSEPAAKKHVPYVHRISDVRKRIAELQRRKKRAANRNAAQRKSPIK